MRKLRILLAGALSVVAVVLLAGAAAAAAAGPRNDYVKTPENKKVTRAVRRGRGLHPRHEALGRDDRLVVVASRQTRFAST